METVDLYNQLSEVVAARDGAAFRSRLLLAPDGGWEAPILRPAVYADGLSEKRPGPIINQIANQDGSKQVTILESYEARAHRIMEALRSLMDDGIELPLIELYLNYNESAGTFSDLILDSFSASHHVTDAYWREAVQPVKGKPFNEFPAFWHSSGSELNPQHPLQPADLLRLYPWALLTGYDPRSSVLSQPTTNDGNEEQQQGGRGRRSSRTAAQAASSSVPDAAVLDELPRGLAKPWGKLVQSSILAVIDGTFVRGFGLVRPERPTGVVYVSANGVDWTSDNNQAKQDSQGKPILWQTKNKDGDDDKPGRPSLIGLDFVTPQKRKYPDVWAKEIVLSSYLSISRLRQLKFSSTPNVDQAARTLVASLAVAGIVIADESLSPRADCDLTVDHDKERPVRREIVRHGGVVDVGIDPEAAVGLVRHAIARLEEAQSNVNEILWLPETIKLVAGRQLRGLIQPAAQ